MAILTRDQILQAQDIQREVVSVPEWGGEVLVVYRDGAPDYEIRLRSLTRGMNTPPSAESETTPTSPPRAEVTGNMRM